MFEGICERGRGENLRFCKGLRAFGFFPNLGVLHALKPSAIPNFAKPGYSIFQLWSNMWSRGHVRGNLRGGKGRKPSVLQGILDFRFFPNLGGVTCSQSARIGFTWARKKQVRYHISESRMSSRCGQFCGHRPLSAGACRGREAGKNRRRSRPLVYYKRLRREMQRFFESTRNENGFEAIRDEMIGSNSEWNPTILHCCARGRGKRLLWAGAGNVGTHFVRCLLFAPRRRGGYLCPSWVLAAWLAYWPSPQRQPVVLCFA